MRKMLQKARLMFLPYIVISMSAICFFEAPSNIDFAKYVNDDDSLIYLIYNLFNLFFNHANRAN